MQFSGLLLVSVTATTTINLVASSVEWSEKRLARYLPFLVFFHRLFCVTFNIAEGST